MSKRQAFSICGEEFRTKGALRARIQGILYSYAEGEALTEKDFSFMRDVLARHPRVEDKVGCGVAGMFVATNPGYATRGFQIRRADGSTTDFSFIECLSPSSKESKVQSAFRAAVNPDILWFKQAYFTAFRWRPPVCPFTGESLSLIGSHVDHEPPYTFQNLMNEFLTFYGCNVYEIQVNNSGDNTFQDSLVDVEMAAAWIKFHRERAMLRVVSQRANLSIIKSNR